MARLNFLCYTWAPGGVYCPEVNSPWCLFLVLCSWDNIVWWLYCRLQVCTWPSLFCHRWRWWEWTNLSKCTTWFFWFCWSSTQVVYLLLLLYVQLPLYVVVYDVLLTVLQGWCWEADCAWELGFDTSLHRWNHRWGVTILTCARFWLSAMFYIVLFQMWGCTMLDGSVTLLFLLALH